MLNEKRFTLLSLDSSLKIHTKLEEISKQLDINYLNTLCSMDTLYSLMDLDVDLIVIQTDSSNLAILELLEMIGSDIENQETPIVIVSDNDEYETLAEDIKSFNVLNIFTYQNWHYQFFYMLKYLKSQRLSSFNLECELSESEVRNVIDPLTGALNRYGGEDTFVNLVSRYKAYNEKFALVMLDIDHFKQVNDTHGHDVGDEVLVSLSSLILHSIRSSDKLVRFGGEEFFIFLSNVDTTIAVKIAEKFRQSIEEKRHSSKELTITASFGVVSYSENETFESLQKRADDFLYRAKDEGRNRVIYM